MTSKAQMEKVCELFKKVQVILGAEEEEDRISGRRFNIFCALGVERSELAHSRFLACFLDPKGVHGQRDIFLRRFVEDVLLERTEGLDLEKSEVVIEKNIQTGRLDVQVILAGGQIVVLENKIDAGEGEAQLEHYRNWLQAQPRAKSGKPHHLVFLTPDGRQPTSCSATGVKSVSYERITDWLDKLRSKVPDPLRCVIGQYADLWRGIPMNDELRTLLHDPSNFETAESISMAVEQVKEEAKTQFMDRVQQDLKRRLEAIQLASNWDASRTPKIKGLTSCGLLWRGRNVDPLNRTFPLKQYTVLCEVQDANWTDIIVGICRGAEVKNNGQAALDQEISRRLLRASDQRFQQSDWWPGYIKLRNLVGGRTIGVKELMAEGHHLSKLVADELWRLFEACRNELEDLNRNYPY